MCCIGSRIDLTLFEETFLVTTDILLKPTV
jgi:hypothetical protein